MYTRPEYIDLANQKTSPLLMHIRCHGEMVASDALFDGDISAEFFLDAAVDILALAETIVALFE